MADQEIYKTPESRVESAEPVVMTPVEKPWPRILIAVWMFFAFSVIANIFAALLGHVMGLNDQDSKMIGVLFIVVGLVLMHGVVEMKKYRTMATVIVVTLLGVFQSYNAISQILYVEGGLRIGAAMICFLVIPSFLTAWYLSRKQYRNLCDQNESFVKYDAMRKHLSKSMRI